MISLRDRAALRQRFAQDVTSRIRVDFFSQKPSRVIIPGRDECVHCEETKALLNEVQTLNDRIALTTHDLDADRELAKQLGVDKAPAIVIRGAGNRPLRFFGMPGGAEFPSFIEIMIEASKTASNLAPETARVLRKIKSDIKIQVLVAFHCSYSPATARSASRLALASNRVKLDIVEVTEFPTLMQRHSIAAVPMTLIDDKLVVNGAIDEAGLVQRILEVAEGKPLLRQVNAGPTTPLTSPSQSPGPRPVGNSGLVLPR